MGNDKAEDKPGNAGTLPTSEAWALGQLIDVAPEAVVSRTLVKNKAGTITLFAFDQGQELSEHSAPFDAFVQVIGGELELTIGGQSVPTRAGEVVLMPADVPHGLKAVEPTRMLLVMIRGKK